jgi:acyl carrier protein
MAESTIQEKIKSMISNEVLVGVSVEEIGSDASLISDLAMDSIQMLALITGLENEFGFILEDEDLDMENLSSVNRIADFVQQKLG